jgi:hypothetical protein
LSSTIISNLDQVGTQWLTEVLSNKGALVEGAVTKFALKRDERMLSSVGYLTVTYSQDAQGRRPRNLFLKICKLDLDGNFLGPSEVNYYTRDYTGVGALPMLTCYDAVYSAERDSYHILLDDISSTHQESHGRTLTLDYGLAVAEGLARMHVHWWGMARLAAGGEPIPTAAQIERYVAIARAGLQPMLESCRSEIDSSWETVLLDIFAHHPSKMIERTANGNGFTLVHGDANPGNILAPVNGDTPIYLIDRQPFDWSLTTWLGVSDLAYMMVHWWEADVRRKLEIPILRRYHDCLLANGAVDYSWEQLLVDYRLSAVQSVYVASEWCRFEEDCVEMKWLWLSQLQRAMIAFFDLQCDRLWW